MYPVLFEPFGFKIYSYSFVLIVSFILSMMLVLYLGRRRGPIDADYIQELAMWAIVWGLIGSRLGWVVQHPEQYLPNPLSIFNLREGGMTILGGIIVPTVTLVVTCYRRGIEVRNVLDLFSAPLLLGMAIGRIGCVLHGCCYGDACPADFPFSLIYPEAPGMPVGPRYPAQFFEAGADLLLMGFLIWFFPRAKFAGQTFWIALGGYGLIRFLNEFVRADGREVVAGGFTIAQFTALGMLLFGAASVFGLMGRPPIDVSWQTGPAPEENKPARRSKKR